MKKFKYLIIFQVIINVVVFIAMLIETNRSYDPQAPAFFVFPLLYIVFIPLLVITDFVLFFILIQKLRSIKIPHHIILSIWMILPFILFEDLRFGFEDFVLMLSGLFE